MDLAIDDNNNNSEKSYSLRPRAATRKEREDVEEEETWKPRNRSRRRQKPKSAPLSKYRRKTANARERSRMREINDAFESLRKAIPHLASNCVDSNSEKTSKIMTLRLAMKYITALSNALDEPETYALDLQANLLLDNSSTTSSVSDQTSWRDQLFSSTSPLESTFSIQSPLPCSVRSADSLSRVQFEPNSSSRTFPQPPSDQGSFSHFFINRTPDSAFKTSPDIKRLPQQPHGSSIPELSRHTLTPPDDSSLHLPFEDMQPNPSSSTTEFQFQASSSFFNTDFDGLPSPVMDFCDLFVT